MLATVVVLTALALALVGVLTWLLLDRRRGLHRLVGGHVVLQTDNGVSTQGLVEALSRDCVVLSHARHLEQGGSVPLSGEVLVPRGRIWRYDAPRAADLTGTVEA